MKLSLIDRIERYLKSNPDTWYHKGDIAKLAESVGYMGETCGRRLREMVEDGTLETKENEKGHAMYKWKKTEKTVSKFIVENGRAVEVKETILV